MRKNIVLSVRTPINTFGMPKGVICANYKRAGNAETGMAG